MAWSPSPPPNRRAPCSSSHGGRGGLTEDAHSLKLLQVSKVCSEATSSHFKVLLGRKMGPARQGGH